MSEFNYNAPQYIDFTRPDELDLENFGDEYFEMDHEVEVEYREGVNDDPLSVSDLSTSVCDKFESDKEPEFVSNPLRRSVSAGHLLLEVEAENGENSLINALNNLQLHSKTPATAKKTRNGFSQILPSKQKLLPSTSKSTKVLNKYSMSRDAIHKIGVHGNKDMKRKMSTESLNSIQSQPNKYISLAEAIHRFQFATPQRFHTQSNKSQFVNDKLIALSYTIANSPMLATKARSRPTTYRGHEEQEQIEAEEMKKNRIKAHPMNYKILRAPVLPKTEKNVTTTQPFKFSEVKFQSKPVKVEEEKIYEFHAKPAPKTTAPGSIPISRRSVLPAAVPKKATPSYSRKMRTDALPSVCEKSNNKLMIKTVEVCHDGVPKQLTSSKLVKTQLKPFSFEERDRRMQEKKEQKIKKFLEDEKKAREFHARPIPVKVISQARKVESKIGKFITEGGSTSSLSKIHYDENTEPETKCFKARPATVVHKKPFIPKKEDRPLLEINEFNLNTNQRAKEREEFDRKIKEQEEKIDHMKKESAEIRKIREEEEIKKIRKETVHKANPIKHYKPVEIQASTKPITNPQSPMISRRHRKFSESN